MHRAMVEVAVAEVLQDLQEELAQLAQLEHMQ